MHGGSRDTDGGRRRARDIGYACGWCWGWGWCRGFGYACGWCRDIGYAYGCGWCRGCRPECGP
ncbi:MAG: hypothetical protein JO242_07120 [Streptosporangiaceae bacterium]|nr:hypothetical protein [Streptosporangiaceae bacterium]